MLEDFYEEYFKILEQALEAEGSLAPHAEALCLMSLVEGTTIFVGSRRRWRVDRETVFDTVLEFIDTKYGEEP
jgi:hypothetical protein